jgi:DNA-binding Xre family transcriptional regulator
MAQLIIRYLAEAKHLRQGQLQELSKVTPQLLNRYWHGQTQRVELRALEQIAKALEVKPGDLIISDEDTPQEVVTKLLSH